MQKGSAVLGVVGCVNLPFSPNEVLPAPSAKSGCLAVAIREHGSTLYDLFSDAHRSLVLTQPHHFTYTAAVSRQRINHSETFARLCEAMHLSLPVLEVDSMCKYVMVAMGCAEMYFRENVDPSYRVTPLDGDDD